VSGIVFDAGGLIALDRNDRRVLALIAPRGGAGSAHHYSGDRLGAGDPQARAPGATFASHPATQHRPDCTRWSGATAVGLLLSQTGTADIVDAHVVVCARRADQTVITSDPGDLRRIAPELPLFVI
jgi:hypothetical protein